VIERADLIVLAPAPPVLEFLRGFGDRLFADLDIDEVFLPAWPLFGSVKLATYYGGNIVQSAGVSSSGIQH